MELDRTHPAAGPGRRISRPPALQGVDATQPLILVYDEFWQSPIPFAPSPWDGAVLRTHPMRVTEDRTQFDQWSAIAAAGGGTAGAISIIDCTNQQWIPFSIGDADPTDTNSKCNHDGGNPGLTGWVNVIVYDQATLELWGNTGFVPAFLDESIAVEDALVEEAVPVEDAVFDLVFDLPGSEGSRLISLLKMSVSLM